MQRSGGGGQTTASQSPCISSAVNQYSEDVQHTAVRPQAWCSAQPQDGGLLLLVRLLASATPHTQVVGLGPTG
jgi:hypothetical protein